MKRLALIAALSFVVLPAVAQDSPRIYAPDGTYLGKLNANRYDPESVSNPYGTYGSKTRPTASTIHMAPMAASIPPAECATCTPTNGKGRRLALAPHSR